MEKDTKLRKFAALLTKHNKPLASVEILGEKEAVIETRIEVIRGG